MQTVFVRAQCNLRLCRSRPTWKVSSLCSSGAVLKGCLQGLLDTYPIRNFIDESCDLLNQLHHHVEVHDSAHLHIADVANQ